MDLQIPRKFTFATAQISGPAGPPSTILPFVRARNFNIQHWDAWAFAPALIKPSPADRGQDNKGSHSRNRNRCSVLA